METIQITKDKTAIIKGIAILFMIANHCLLEKYYLNPSPFLSTALGRELCVFTKICVPIFTFIVGYGFFYSYKNFCAYLKRHGGTLLKYYWFYLFILAIPLVAFTGEYSVDAKNVALNCLFFSKATKSFFQSSEMWPSNIIVVFVIVTVVSYIGSVVFNTIFKKLDSCNVGRN